jgi:hypothetical protein
MTTNKSKCCSADIKLKVIGSSKHANHFAKRCSKCGDDCETISSEILNNSLKDILQEFDLSNGEAPEGTLKAERAELIKRLITKAYEQGVKEGKNNK